MKPEPLQNSQQLEQDYQATLAALREEKNQQISEYQAQAWVMAQRASKAESERDALQSELSSLKADMFVLNNDMGYTTGVLEDVLKQRDALQAECDALRRGHDKTHQSIDRALAALTVVAPKLGRSAFGLIDYYYKSIQEAIKILTGEGENA